MSRRIIIALSCGALGLGGAFVAGCGSDKKDSASTPAVATTTPAAATTTPSTKPGAINVVMQNNLFAPDEIKAKVGEKIHWTNNDPYPHNVTSKTFKSKNINGGGTFDFTPKKAGVYKYLCTIHSGQTGTITVTN